jgi:hypothetical protein
MTNVCAKCGGKCCKDVFVTQNEMVRLSKHILNPEMYALFFVNYKNSYIIRGVCPFKSNIGCILPNEYRPLDCKIFPHLFVLDKMTFVRSKLSDHCPSTKNFLNKKTLLHNRELIQQAVETGMWNQSDYENYINMPYPIITNI